MEIKIYVDASSEGYGAILLGDSKIVAMFSCGSSKRYEHSSTLEMEGLVRTLKAFKPFILGQKFTVYSDNWSVLRVLHGRSAQALVLRRLEEIIWWYSNIQFVEGKASAIADCLRRHPLVQLPKSVSVPVKISMETRAMVSSSDEQMSLVESFLCTRQLPMYLSLDDRVAIKRSS